jgi:hypothetical protein
MRKKGASFWDILAWVVLALIVLWLILKVFGVIGTPTLIEYFPYVRNFQFLITLKSLLFLGFFGFGLAYWAGWAINKLTVVSSDVNQLKNFAKDTVGEVNCIKNELNKINLRCEYNHPKKKS